MKDEDIKLPEMVNLSMREDWHNAIEEYARQAVRMNMSAAQPKPSDPEPFDLARAMAGEPIVTRDGRKARFVAHVPEVKEESARVLVVIDGDEHVSCFGETGFFARNDKSELDLFMAPKPKRTVWVNVWKNRHGYLLSSAHATTDQAAYSAQKEKDLGYLTTLYPIEIDA